MAQAGDMTGKTCVVTGANSGIGKETALRLARMGARVVLVCRNADKGKAALHEVARESKSAQPELLIADISSQASVRELSSQIREKHKRLDVLLNNAGAGLNKRQVSADGIEMTVALNHLGPFLLTSLLIDLLKASAPSRVINVSSEASRRAKIDMSDPEFKRRKYTLFGAYGQAKLMLNMSTFEMARRVEGTGVTVNCLHPGVVATNFGGSDAPLGMKIVFGALRPFLLSPQQGAQTSLYLASSPDVAQVSGKYFTKSKPAESNPLARDPQLTADVWAWSEKMTGARFA
jgi:NAD(P)-dependent dehydrogenase (short-subunit alcohol dehydrogenase family)